MIRRLLLLLLLTTALAAFGFRGQIGGSKSLRGEIGDSIGFRGEIGRGGSEDVPPPPIEEVWLATNNDELRDTRTRTDLATRNFGSTNIGTVGTNGGTTHFRQYMWPNLAGSGVTGTILEARAVLFLTNTAVGAPVVGAYPITEDYVNGNLNQEPGMMNWTNRGQADSTGVGGTAFVGTVAWTTPGGTLGTVESTVAAAGLLSTDSLVFDVTNTVQAILDGTAFGIGFKIVTESGTNYVQPGTLESAAADRPNMYIQWQP